MSKDIFDCLKREWDICVRNHNTQSKKVYPALNLQSSMQHDLFIAASFVQLLHSSCKLVNLDELSKHVLMPEPKYWPSTFSRSDIASSKNSEREYSKLMQALDYVSGLHTVSNSRNSPPV